MIPPPEQEGTNGGQGPGQLRRWLVIVVTGVGLGLLAAFTGWFVWFPHYRPSLDEGERFGVDVSNYQGEIDWHAVAGDDIDFAYIKATEGGDWVDASFTANWEGARTAGLERGAYHFFTLCRSGDQQAENFLGVLPNDPGMLAPAVDLEIPGNCSDRPAREWVDRELSVFVDRVEEETGKQVVLYVGADFDNRYAVTDTLDRPVWHRRIFLRPDFDGWLIWQFSDRARVDGVSGGVDLNVMTTDVDGK